MCVRERERERERTLCMWACIGARYGGFVVYLCVCVCVCARSESSDLNGALWVISMAALCCFLNGTLWCVVALTTCLVSPQIILQQDASGQFIPVQDQDVVQEVVLQ